MKSALRAYLIVSSGLISILLIGSLRSPPPIRLRRTSPAGRGRINRSMLSCRDMAPWLSTHSPTAPRGEGGGASHQRGNAFPTPAGRLYGFPTGESPVVKVLYKTGAFYQLKGAVPRQRSGASYLPRAEPSTRPGGVSRSRTEPLAPRAERPGGAINPRGEAASTFGNTGKHRFLTKAHLPPMSHTAKKHQSSD